jgi:hypothetical protein
MKMIVWAVGGGARWGMMRFGGSSTNISAEVEVTGPYPLGKGFSAYIAKSPVDGSTHIVEAKSGAFIGTTLAQVRKDVKSGTVKEMGKQVAAAILDSNHTERITAEDFWSHTFKDSK